MNPRARACGACVAIVGMVVAAGCGGTRTVTTTVTVVGPTQAPPRETTLYGHIRSLARVGNPEATRKGRRFELRFDPAWWLTGFAAERASLEDTGSIDVPNDSYRVEEGHRLLTYLVLPTTHVTVLTRHGVGPIPVTAVTVAELAQIVAGKNPNHRLLTEPKAGFWIRVGNKYPNPVVSLDQQYQP